MDKKIDGNEKIAYLLGMQETKIGWYDSEENLHLSHETDNTFDDLLFRDSWDWLMSAVEFVEELSDGRFQVDILQEGCRVKDRCKTILDMTVSKVPEGTTKIEAVWLALVDFITWYEKLNETKEDETKVKKVLFGSMTFLEEQFDGVFKTIVHRIDSVQFLTEEQANDVIDGDKYDCYFIPEYYKGEVEYECEQQ